MTDWFYLYLKGKTDFDALPRQSPPYWSHYAFVDINRDAHQKNFAATRAVSKMFFDYHPVVVHDLHEAISLMLSWNGTGPYNPHMDPDRDLALAGNELPRNDHHERHGYARRVDLELR